ncbi:hypothetical protein [Pontibacter cellulosilyticus]|uniref:Gliding motility-associated C-terminal domain-containing protein n=1 Tax=Pontibacter cellulosilyticus TaxID=1720253 RepID=A0A923SJZ0_9BACT|nr:hypothetical protein [Pontibacter cellulosilyticus]MBC5993251.1 hypothetical protein [Pontibacter cellulosilyticus]
MKAKVLSFAIALIALLNLGTATAQNLVVKQYPTATDLGTDLQLCVDFAGLGNINEVDIIVNYTAVVETYCINRGQQKQDCEPVPGLTRTLPNQSSTLTFDVRNGRTRGCQILYTDFEAGDCPDGMRSIVDVTFKNVSFTILGRFFNLGDIAPVAPSNVCR